MKRKSIEELHADLERKERALIRAQNGWQLARLRLQRASAREDKRLNAQWIANQQAIAERVENPPGRAHLSELAEAQHGARLRIKPC